MKKILFYLSIFAVLLSGHQISCMKKQKKIKTNQSALFQSSQEYLCSLCYDPSPNDYYTNKCVKRISELFESGEVDPNKMDNKGRRPLCCICERGDIERLTLLLERGADPNLADEKGQTPLNLVLQKKFWDGRYLDAVKLLVEKGGAKITQKVIDKTDDESIKDYLINQLSQASNTTKKRHIPKCDEAAHFKKVGVIHFFNKFTEHFERTLEDNSRLKERYSKSNIALINKIKNNIKELEKKDIKEIKDEFNKIYLMLRDVYFDNIGNTCGVKACSLYRTFEKVMESFDQDYDAEKIAISIAK